MIDRGEEFIISYKRCVYDSEIDDGPVAEVLQEHLFGKWSKVEEEMLKVGQEQLCELV